MKTKLLKKVRKKYQIWFYPADTVQKYMSKENTYMLINKYDIWDTEIKYLRNLTETDCINYLKDCLIDKLKSKYPKLGSKRHKKVNQPRKVWP